MDKDFTVKLSDDEIGVLEKLMKEYNLTTANEALKKAIAQAGYLLREAGKDSNQKIFLGNVKGDKLEGRQINISDAKFRSSFDNE
jgi:hypothetical protein